MKHSRQEKILQIISENTVETQEQLIEKLIEAGYNVTQATVSRDVRELKLMKISCGLGVYKYVVSNREPYSHSAKFLNILKETVVSIDHAGNLVVVKTYPGMAQAVAAGIDSLHEADILGCVAGDDCIIIVTRDTDSAIAISHRITKLINS